MCAGLEAGIEGATHTVIQRRLDKVRRRSREEDYGSAEGEEEIENVEGLLHNLSIEKEGTEEEAAEGLESALCMEFEGDDQDEGVGNGEEEGVGTLRALGAL